MDYKSECVLMDRDCIDCGECDLCDLDRNKICDNCCQCIDSDSEYKGIYIDDIIESDSETDLEDIETTKFEVPVKDEIDKD